MASPGNTREVAKSLWPGNPTLTRIIKSQEELFLALSRHWQLSPEGNCSIVPGRIAHSCTPIRAGPLKSPIDSDAFKLYCQPSPFTLLISKSSCPAHSLAGLGTLDSAALAASDLTCFPQCGWQAGDYPGRNGELCVTAAFRADQYVHTKRHAQHSRH